MFSISRASGILVLCARGRGRFLFVCGGASARATCDSTSGTIADNRNRGSTFSICAYSTDPCAGVVRGVSGRAASAVNRRFGRTFRVRAAAASGTGSDLNRVTP